MCVCMLYLLVLVIAYAIEHAIRVCLTLAPSSDSKRSSGSRGKVSNPGSQVGVSVTVGERIGIEAFKRELLMALTLPEAFGMQAHGPPA
ncbi:hypothetical protein B0H21DRAFT_481992 [Amylocystis lapponica]|nr:hypothetical protein B0H21DRAFT_481992 [Amylocystis lapponica]